MPLLLYFSVSISIIPAWGAEPMVIYTESPDKALRAAAEQIGEGGEIIAWPLATIRARPPHVVGTGTVYICGSRAEGRASELLDRARQAIGLVQLDAASALLERALDAVVCGQVDSASVFDIWFLHGIVATYHQDLPAARTFFRNARIADPERPWDEQFADGRELFANAAPSEPVIPLSLLPNARVWTVDGRPVTDQPIVLTPGSHLLEIGDGRPITVRVDLDGHSSAVLVLPALLPDSVLRWPSEPERWYDLSLVLGEQPEAKAVALYADPDLWWATHPRGPYTHLQPPLQPPPPPPRAPFPRWTIGLGGAGLLGVAGAAICTAGGLAAHKEVNALREGPYEPFSAALARAQHFSACVAASDAVAGLGLGSAAFGTISWVISK